MELNILKPSKSIKLSGGFFVSVRLFSIVKMLFCGARCCTCAVSEGKSCKSKSPETIEISGLFRGAPAEIRTPDTLLKRQVLCLLSYWGILNWLGWRDSNPLYQSQSLRCYHYTTSHHLSCFIVSKGRAFVRPSLYMGWVKGLEPSTPGTTIRCSNQLSYTHHIIHLARQEGFEPPTYCLEGSCSILLSYWRISLMPHIWSGRWESNPRIQLGRLVFYH